VGVQLGVTSFKSASLHLGGEERRPLAIELYKYRYMGSSGFDGIENRIISKWQILVGCLIKREKTITANEADFAYAVAA
jgi:hypothetical protein